MGAENCFLAQDIFLTLRFLLFCFYPTYTFLTFCTRCSFHRANKQGALNGTENVNGNVTGTLDLSWYLGIYAGKVSSFGLLYKGLRCSQ